MSGIEYRRSPPVSNEELSQLLSGVRAGAEADFAPVLKRSLGYVCAYLDGSLVGFVNVAWDGGVHAFLLDPTVRIDLRRRGIGRRLVLIAEMLAREKGIGWLHVDFQPELRGFYAKCGFRDTSAGLIDLREAGSRSDG